MEKNKKQRKQKRFNELKTKQLLELKAAYKKGKLKFDSKKIAEAMLREFKSGMTR